MVIGTIFYNGFNLMVDIVLVAASFWVARNLFPKE